MDIIKYLREKYNRDEHLKYEPSPACPRCHGTGEIPVRGLPHMSSTVCACTYIGGGVLADAMMEHVAKVAKRLRQEMDDGHAAHDHDDN